jgi:hypothetical protein
LCIAWCLERRTLWFYMTNVQGQFRELQELATSIYVMLRASRVHGYL